MSSITLDDLTHTQRKLYREVKRGERLSVKLSKRLYENPLEQTIRNNIVYLSDTRDSGVSTQNIVGKYGGIVIKYYHQVWQPYILILPQENKRLYGFPLRFVRSYKRLK